MPYYRWTGVILTGKIVRGSLVAASVTDLDALLFKQSIALMRCKERPHRLFNRSVSLRDTVEIFRQLAALTAAGILVPDALKLIAQQVSKKALQDVVGQMASLVGSGKLLSQAMELYPHCFDPLIIQLIAAGEHSGDLSSACTTIVDYLDERCGFYRKVSTSLMVPAITILFFIFIAGLLVYLVVPRIAQMLLSLNQPLPPLTKALLAVSSFALSYRMAMLIMGVTALGLLVRAWVRGRGKAHWDRLLFSLPFVGTIMRLQFIAYFCGSLALLVAKGIRLPAALAMVSGAVSNRFLHKHLAALRATIESGSSLADALVAHNDRLWDNQAIAMIAVGQESSSLPAMLKAVARRYQEKVTDTLTRYTVIIQPLAMILLGLVIAFFIAAIYLPIIGISQGF